MDVLDGISLVWLSIRYVLGYSLRTLGLVIFILSFTLFDNIELKREFLLFGLTGAIAYFIGGVFAP